MSARRGTVFRRCARCHRRMSGKRCSGCGSDAGTWYYHVDINMPGAPRRQLLKGGFATKADATAAMVSMQAELASGTRVEPSKMTLGQYLDRWIEEVRVRATTRKSYRGAIAKLRPLIGDVRLQLLDRAMVRGAYDKLSSTPVGGRLPARKTIHNVHLALSAALAAAVDERLIKANAAHGAHKFSRENDQTEMRYWSATELRKFFLTLSGQDLALYRLLAYTGMRRGEVLGLRWEDVDLGAARLSVRQQLTRIEQADGYVWGFGPPKTRAARRTIDLDPATVAVLRSHRDRQAEARRAMLEAYTGDLVVAGGDGRHLDPDVVSQNFAKLVTAAEVPAIRLHDLRHTHATLLLKAGQPVKVVSERLGHAKVSTTMDLYQHVIPGMQREAAAAFAAVIDAAE